MAQKLSKGGTLTLIKSTLSNMPIYTMSLFRMPISVAKRLRKYKEFFFFFSWWYWGGGWGEVCDQQNKLHLANWKPYCKDTRAGGLRIKILVNLNLATKYGTINGGWSTKKKKKSTTLMTQLCGNLSEMCGSNYKRP